MQAAQRSATRQCTPPLPPKSAAKSFSSCPSSSSSCWTPLLYHPWPVPDRGPRLGVLYHLTAPRERLFACEPYAWPLQQCMLCMCSLQASGLMSRVQPSRCPALPLWLLIYALQALRVQVPNNHILTQNLYYNYYSPKPRYPIIGYLDPLGSISRNMSNIPGDNFAQDLASHSQLCLHLFAPA